VEAEFVAGRPHPGLAGCVAGYSGYREHSTQPLRRRQAPTGSCTLILGFGGPIRLHGPAGPTVPAAFLAGIHDAAIITEFTGHQHGVQVNLSPLGVFRLLGRPLPELTNCAPHLDELAVPALAALPDRLADTSTWAQRFAHVDTVLLRLLDATTVRPDPEVAWAWTRLERSGGRGHRAGAGRRYGVEPPAPVDPLPRPDRTGTQTGSASAAVPSAAHKGQCAASRWRYASGPRPSAASWAPCRTNVRLPSVAIRSMVLAACGRSGRACHSRSSCRETPTSCSRGRPLAAFTTCGTGAMMP